MTEQTYTHRNGETERPSEQGEYWFRGKIGRHEAACRVEIDATGDLEWWMGTYHASDAEGQWWGPIVPPWEDDA